MVHLRAAAVRTDGRFEGCGEFDWLVGIAEAVRLFDYGRRLRRFPARPSLCFCYWP